MSWFGVSLWPKDEIAFKQFPFFVGRELNGQMGWQISIPTISRLQFGLQLSGNDLEIQSLGSGGLRVNGEEVFTQVLSSKRLHELRFGCVLMVVGTSLARCRAQAQAMARARYLISGKEYLYGPMTDLEILEECQAGTLTSQDFYCSMLHPDRVSSLRELVDFGEAEEVAEPPPATQEMASPSSVPGGVPPAPAPVSPQRFTSAEEREAVLGESFMCPYCRTVAEIEDVLSVSVSPGLLGDSVLGEGEQQRFLPSYFTGNGLAIDSEGGVCTQIACPRCHMALPRTLLDLPQVVMSVIGAAGAGKSVFLASSMWQCRQLLRRYFGLGFMDLDPETNLWINNYESKLFFQEDVEALQQIEKTDLQATNVCRQVLLDGERVLLPLPSFFQVQPREGALHSFVVYDSAGEHFRPGADVHASRVTYNLLGADALFFMFDPSADPRFRASLNLGSGTAHNVAQRQDTLLAEMAARIRRYLGNHGPKRLTRPLIFGVSKADLLCDHLPLGMELYRPLPEGGFALDWDALRTLSARTEVLLDSVVPEVTATAHDIAEEVWFLPVSALGHNPLREGVRPCDVKPLWAEVPVAMTLAKKGLIPSVGADEGKAASHA